MQVQECSRTKGSTIFKIRRTRPSQADCRGHEAAHEWNGIKAYAHFPLNTISPFGWCIPPSLCPVRVDGDHRFHVSGHASSRPGTPHRPASAGRHDRHGHQPAADDFAERNGGRPHLTRLSADQGAAGQHPPLQSQVPFPVTHKPQAGWLHRFSCGFGTPYLKGLFTAWTGLQRSLERASRRFRHRTGRRQRPL